MRTIERTQQELASAQQKLDRVQQERDSIRQELDRAHQEATQALRGQIIGEIALCEQLLNRPATPEAELQALSFEQLETLASQLRRELVG